MKSIKYFQYKNTWEFERFLRACKRWLEDAVGFSVVGVERYRGNILKTYAIYLSDGAKLHFKVVFFKDFFACKRAPWGFEGNKLLEWYEGAAVKHYKVKDDYGIKDWYVIES